MTRNRRPGDSRPELAHDEEEKTNPDPLPGRSRLTTPARALEVLPGFAPGREVGRREGVILACEKFIEQWLSNPANDVGRVFLVAQALARACGVDLPPPLPGARAATGGRLPRPVGGRPRG